MYWHKIDFSNDMSFMKIVRLVYDSQLERQIHSVHPSYYRSNHFLIICSLSLVVQNDVYNEIDMLNSNR